MYKLLPFLSLILLSFFASAQQWELSGEAGLAIPVGSFSSKNPIDARIVDESTSPPFIAGFSKQDNGFAKTGIEVSFQAGYRLFDRLKPFVRYTFQYNEVRENTMSQDLSAYFSEEYVYRQDAYQFHFLTGGLDFRLIETTFNLDVHALAGLGLARYPEYSYLVRLNTLDITYEHDGDTGSLSGFTYGFGATLSYDFSPDTQVGLHLNYMASDFDYSANMRFTPGGSGEFSFDDTLVLRSLNLGVHVTFRL